jgi:hypothetical protein
MVTVVECSGGAKYRRAWMVVDGQGERVTVTRSLPHAVDAAACLLVALERELDEAEARDQAAHQALRDRERDHPRDPWAAGVRRQVLGGAA